MSKIELRKDILSRRKQLSDISDLLVNDLYLSKILDKYKTIAIYYPLKYEINVLKLINLYKDKNFLFPKVVNNKMFFINDSNISSFKLGKFNVYEPVTNNIVDISDIDIIIVPCVGIFSDNKRLGYGKGYYDSYLKNQNILKISLIQKELTDIGFDSEEHDIKIDVIFKR